METDIIQLDLYDLSVALSDALGLVGGKVVDHGKRVGVIALRLAREMGIDGEDFDDLRHASLLHDAGVSRSRLHQRLTLFDWEGALDHCVDGANLLRGFRYFQRVAEIIRHHHDKWGDIRPDEVSPRIALLANVVFLADRVDIMINWNQEIILNREPIESRIAELSGAYFNPDGVEAFMACSARETFWLDLHPRHLPRALAEFRPSRPLVLPLDDLEALAGIFARIVDDKSRFTRDHSYGVARLCGFLGQFMGRPEITVQKLRIAGLLHDLGKLAVPDEILEKPGPLTREEYQIIKRHPYETYFILSGLPAMGEIRDWAAFHHERPDGSGYPFHVRAGEVGTEHMIVMVADVIQALIQDRPYRPGMGRDDVLSVLSSLPDWGAEFQYLVDGAKREYATVEALARGTGAGLEPVDRLWFYGRDV